MNRSLSTLSFRSLVITVVLAAPVCAQNLTTFVNGTPANADQVNANFSALKTSVQTAQAKADAAATQASLNTLTGIVGNSATTGLQGSVGNLTTAIAPLTGAITVTAGGNVGIGVAPTAKLDVNGKVRIAANQFLTFGADNEDSDPMYVRRTSNGANDTNLEFVFGDDSGAAGTDRVRFSTGDVSGNVSSVAMQLDSNGRMTLRSGLNIDTEDATTGSLSTGLRFGAANSGEGILSRRTAGGNAFGLDFVTGGALRMSITNNGRVGIGLPNPQSRLHVDGGVPFVAGVGGSFFSNNATSVGFSALPASAAIPYGILCTGADIGCSQSYFAFSDERIKNIVGRSDTARDLAILNGIEISDYSFKDVVTRGSRTEKKVIAQQVESVYPQAVTRSTEVVPDIYQGATQKDGWVTLATDLKVGDRVRLIGEKEQGVHEVLEIGDGAFRTGFVPAGEKVFVFGREVDDFRSVDYDAISMLNVSATQELARKVTNLTTNNEALTRTVAAITTENEALKSSLGAMAAEVAQLKTALQPLLAK